MRINIFTEVSGFSYGVFGKNLAIELNKQLEVCLIPAFYKLTCIEKNEVSAIEQMLIRTEKVSFNDIGLMFANGDQMIRFCGRKKIGMTFFFTDVLTNSWINQLKQLDMVCVPSQWQLEILKKYNINSAVVPPGVHLEIFKPSDKQRENLKFDETNKFKFFSIGKWDTRKNQKIMIEAFCEEFSADEPVALYGMWDNPFMSKPLINEVLGCISNKHKIYTHNNEERATIHLINSVSSFQQLSKIYRDMHCAVFPYKSEATGLRLFECLACGIPCIATDYSAPAEYLNDTFVYLLKKNQKKLLKEEENYSKVEGYWVEPNKEELKKTMRGIYNNYSAALAKAKIAVNEMKKMSWWHSANKLVNCILNVANKKK
ncbi:MAG TPA: glycosyltransferase [bacterium]|nr:glycosyltransferase [bacterium]